MISVGPDGDNSIVVSPGANALVDEQQIADAAQLLQVAKVTLLQLEIPVEAVTLAAESAGGLVVLNPAPAQALTSRILESVDVLVPNETELALLSGNSVATTFDEIVDQARLLPAARTVVTLGAQGALLVDENGRSGHHVALWSTEFLAYRRRSRRPVAASMSGTPMSKIVLDCDPGVDDMFAIFAALRYCDLVAITSVAGNVGIENTTRNALGIVELAGATVPVHRGAAHALAEPASEDASHVHGEGGLGGVDLPMPSHDVASADAVSALFDLTAAGDVTVVAVGPLTNIALAIERDPTWVERIPRLVIMGGSTDSGNVTSTAEFNIWADPQAAKVVFDSGVELTMAGLNLTRQVQMGESAIAALRQAATKTSTTAADALDFYAEFALANYGVKSSAMHDPCAVLEVSNPELFGRQAMKVDVETDGAHTRGMTVCDLRPNPAPADTDVLVHAEAATVVSKIIEAAVTPSPRRN